MLGTGLERLGDAIEVVVVGESEQLDPRRGGAGYDFARAKLAVAEDGVRLKVEGRPLHQCDGTGQADGRSAAASTLRLCPTCRQTSPSP